MQTLHAKPPRHGERMASIAVGSGRLRSGLIVLAAMWVVSGCATLEPGVKEGAPTSVNLTELSEGYSLLYDLISKGKHSNLLSIIKKESPELKDLLEKVSETSKATTKELDTLAKLNPPVTLKAPHLPRLEQAARESINKETSKEILHSNGVDLEFNMVSSQLAGMNYAAHLARTLGAVETNPVRKEFLQRTDRNYSKLHGQMYKMLFARYQRS
jgi:hypothetical protein